MTSFNLADIGLYHALTEYKDYPFLKLIYDVACQFMINKDKRWTEHPVLSSLIDTIKKCECCVNKLHGKGHVDTCKYRYCIDILEYVGRTHGERIESGWSRENGAARITCKMTAGNRHDTLSDNFNEANYQHTDGLSMFAFPFILTFAEYYC